MEADLVIKNGLVVIPETGVIKAALAVKDGIFAGIWENAGALRAKEVIDARGMYVMPGVVQPHAHLGRLEDLEDYATETRSSAVGGVTALIEFHKQWEDYETNFSARVKSAQERAYIDFSFHFHIMSDKHVEQIPTYVKLGVPSFKFMMTNRGNEGKGKEPSEYNDGLMIAALERMRELPGAVACVHAENHEIVAYCTGKFRKEGRDDLAAWSEARPFMSEAEAIGRALYFSELTQCPLYVVHMTTAAGLELIKRHRRRGASTVYAETCPQYLTHTMHDRAVGRLGKFTPPLMTKADNDALWDGLIQGDIDALGVDQITRKADPPDLNIWERSNTPREAATALSVLLSEGVHKRGMDIGRIACLTSYNAARIFNLYPRKGTICLGGDADLVIVDLNLEKTVSKDVIKSASDFSIYEGWTLKGWPVMTICRGKIVMADGEIVGERGWGTFLERRAARP